jgi:hypothetical protein
MRQGPRLECFVCHEPRKTRNNILFPKALKLEKELVRTISEDTKHGEGLYP